MRARLARLASYLLGAFICVELVYLPLANVIQLIPREPEPLPDEILGRLQREGRATDVEPVQSAINTTGTACDRWAQATGQGQGWSLFAPRFGEAGTFLALKVTATDGGTSELRSQFEPADVSHYVRYDVLNYRLFYREMSYALVYSTWTPDSFADQGPEWREAIRDHVRAFRRSLSAYVRWWLEQEMPGASVREVTVTVRVFQPPTPGENKPRLGPMLVPLAQWTAEQLIPYDPVAGKFACELLP